MDDEAINALLAEVLGDLEEYEQRRAMPKKMPREEPPARPQSRWDALAEELSPAPLEPDVPVYASDQGLLPPDLGGQWSHCRYSFDGLVQPGAGETFLRRVERPFKLMWLLVQSPGFVIKTLAAANALVFPGEILGDSFLCESWDSTFAADPHSLSKLMLPSPHHVLFAGGNIALRVTPRVERVVDERLKNPRSRGIRFQAMIVGEEQVLR